MSRKKRFLKTVTWRITATTTTMSIVYLLTGELGIAGSVAGIEVIAKMIIYYIHETIWEKRSLDPKEG